MPLITLVAARPRLPVWRRLQALGDAAVPPFQALWLRLLGRLQRETPRQAVTTALRAGHTLEAQGLLDTARLTAFELPAHAALPPLVAETMTTTAETIGVLLAQQLDVTTLAYNASLPEAMQAASTYARTQIGLMSRSTWEGSQAAIRSFPPPMVSDVMGLTPRDVESVAKLTARLQAQGLSVRQARAQARNVILQRLQVRAQAAAITQAHTAVQAGFDQLLQQAVRAGTIDPEQWLREWVTVADACTRLCASLRGQRVAIGHPFIVPATGATVMYPAVHIRCRCSVTLVRAGATP